MIQAGSRGFARQGLSGFFFFNDTATTEIYTLSLHDALPISDDVRTGWRLRLLRPSENLYFVCSVCFLGLRSEEHTSELQSLAYLVCRLLLEKKKLNVRTCFIAFGISATTQHKFTLSMYTLNT